MQLPRLALLLTSVLVMALAACFEAPEQCMTDPCGAAPDGGTERPVTTRDGGVRDAGPTDGGEDAGTVDAGGIPLTCGEVCTAPWGIGARAMHPYPPGLRGLVVARLDGDCVDDVAAAHGGGQVLIFRGTGNALLEARESYSILGEPTALVAADLDGDGDQDLAVTHGSKVSLLLNSGQGKFEAGGSFPAGGAATQTLLSADVTGNGLPDLLVGTGMPSRLYLLRNLGSGVFSHFPELVMGFDQAEQAPHVAAGDFDGDGIMDLAVSRLSLVLLRGKGDGAFYPPVFRPVNGNVAAGDLNRDGWTDLVVGGWALLNQGNGNLVITATVTNGDDFVLADFNGDGVLDVGATVGISLGNGDGTFKAVAGFGMLPHRWAVAAGNLDGDGRADLALAHLMGSGGESVSILLSRCH